MHLCADQPNMLVRTVLAASSSSCSMFGAGLIAGSHVTLASGKRVSRDGTYRRVAALLFWRKSRSPGNSLFWRRVRRRWNAQRFSLFAFRHFAVSWRRYKRRATRRDPSRLELKTWPERNGGSANHYLTTC